MLKHIESENQLNFANIFFAFFIRNAFHTGMDKKNSCRMTNIDYQQTVENLKVKLALEKQIWNGVAGSVDQHQQEQQRPEPIYQPLSWGISVVNKRNKQTKPDANEELFT